MLLSSFWLIIILFLLIIIVSLILLLPIFSLQLGFFFFPLWKLFILREKGYSLCSIWNKKVGSFGCLLIAASFFFLSFSLSKSVNKKERKGENKKKPLLGTRFRSTIDGVLSLIALLAVLPKSGGWGRGIHKHVLLSYNIFSLPLSLYSYIRVPFIQHLSSSNHLKGVLFIFIPFLYSLCISFFLPFLSFYRFCLQKEFTGFSLLPFLLISHLSKENS